MEPDVKWVEALSRYLDAQAEHLREVTASHGMARYAEGYRDGFLAASIKAGLQVDEDGGFHALVSADNPYDDGMGGPNRPPQGFTQCGFLGCTEPPNHEGRHIIRVTDNDPT